MKKVSFILLIKILLIRNILKKSVNENMISKQSEEVIEVVENF